MLFSSLPKIMIFGLLTKLLVFSFCDFIEFWSFIFLVACLLSIAVGSISALYQKRFKRLLAYSTISHTGFILFGILISTPDSIRSSNFYVFVYSLVTILIFLLLIYLVNCFKFFPKYLAN
jgi:NADH-quinone oxidoreductase subunit N